MSTNHTASALSTRTLPMHPEAPFPVVVAEWQRNSREVVRVSIDEFNGNPTVNARIWYYDGDVLKPGRNGLALGIKQIETLSDAFAKALQQAKDLGLLDGDAE